MPLEEKEILEQKYDKLQDYFKEIVWTLSDLSDYYLII
jgi:hypothetical protein